MHKCVCVCMCHGMHVEGRRKLRSCISPGSLWVGAMEQTQVVTFLPKIGYHPLYFLLDYSNWPFLFCIVQKLNCIKIHTKLTTLTIWSIQINIVMLTLLYTSLQMFSWCKMEAIHTLNNSTDIKQRLIYSFKWSGFHIPLFILLDCFVIDSTVWAYQWLR